MLGWFPSGCVRYLPSASCSPASGRNAKMLRIVPLQHTRKTISLECQGMKSKSLFSLFMPTLLQICLPLGIYSIPICFNLETAELGALNNLVLQCQQTAKPGVLHLLRQDRTLDLAKQQAFVVARLVKCGEATVGSRNSNRESFEKNPSTRFIISSFDNIKIIAFMLVRFDEWYKSDSVVPRLA